MGAFEGCLGDFNRSFLPKLLGCFFQPLLSAFSPANDLGGTHSALSMECVQLADQLCRFSTHNTRDGEVLLRYESRDPITVQLFNFQRFIIIRKSRNLQVMMGHAGETDKNVV